MKKYNCIVVLNEDKTKILFCKRKKNPLKIVTILLGER